MEKENNCSNCKHTNKAEDEFPCSVCVRNYIDKYEPTTNYDRIKSMSVEEMANFLSEAEWKAMQGKSKYPHEWEQWLLQEVSDE